MSQFRDQITDLRVVRDRRASRPLRAIALPVLVFSVFFAATLIPSPTKAGTIECSCESCHGDHHGGNFTGCQACHASPPATGSHLLHFTPTDPSSGVGYGDVGVHSSVSEYRFGCGNCHPMDFTKHRNGSVDVELYNAAAPAGSIKAKNPSTASYAAGTKTCSNVYCHSGKSVTSGPVGDPLMSPPNTPLPGEKTNYGYIMDATCSNLTYAPYTVTVGRSYAAIPPWGAATSFAACTECHPFPLTTSVPAVQASVGDSHQWIDDWGYGNLHAYNMGAAPLQCRACHFATVTEAGTTSRTAMDVTSYGPVPVASHVTHVNGASDVAFDPVNSVPYYRNSYSLAGSIYDPTTKTCSAVPCHVSPRVGSSGARWQSSPKWGQPYRWSWGSAECDQCHRYGSLAPTCLP